MLLTTRYKKDDSGEKLIDCQRSAIETLFGVKASEIPSGQILVRTGEGFSDLGFTIKRSLEMHNVHVGIVTLNHDESLDINLGQSQR